jgi:hypothetical protein
MMESVHLILSRPMAQRIAEDAAANNARGDLRFWIRSMTLPELVASFEASDAELRNLLEFARGGGTDLVAALLNNGFASIQIESAVTECVPGQAQIIPEDQSALPQIQVRANGEVVGYIPVRYRAEVLECLRTGLITTAIFDARAGEGHLEFRLDEPA